MGDTFTSQHTQTPHTLTYTYTVPQSNTTLNTHIHTNSTLTSMHTHTDTSHAIWAPTPYPPCIATCSSAPPNMLIYVLTCILIQHIYSLIHIYSPKCTHVLTYPNSQSSNIHTFTFTNMHIHPHTTFNLHSYFFIWNGFLIFFLRIPWVWLSFSFWKDTCWG